jgi:hypothetical protein
MTYDNTDKGQLINRSAMDNSCLEKLNEIHFTSKTNNHKSMETSKNKILKIACTLIIISLCTAIACENSIAPEPTLDIQKNEISESDFNPQPEPPPKVFEFEIVGDPSGDWTGNFSEFREGRIEVETLSSMMRGKTIRVVQTWIVVPPEPIFPPEPIVPPDPIVPPEPVQISLMGIINLANGKVVLNGLSDELGVNVHVRGHTMTLSSGDISIGGELMFNPQPEPPPGR